MFRSVALAVALVGPALSWAAGPVCALLDPDKVPRAAVLEAKLLADAGATRVERGDIEKVLMEQKFQAAFGPQGVGDRVRLGKLLKADLLVMVRPVKEVKEPALEVVVSETTGGLRLLVRGVPVTKDAEADVAELLAAVREGRAKYAEGVTDVVAVPPFVNNDLEFTHDHLKGAFAKLVEGTALGRKGLAVVELAEAEALAKELALAAPGAKVTRPLPVYLFGEFRHEGTGDKRTVALKLRAERGGRPIQKAAAEVIEPAAAPAALGKWAAGVLDTLVKDDRPRPAAAPRAEAKLLGVRARELMRAGLWADALALLEASLLLDPEQPTVHTDAIKCIVFLGEYVRTQGWIGPGVFKSESYLHGLRIYRRGLFHLEAFHTLGGSMESESSQYSRPIFFMFGIDARMAAAMSRPVQELFAEVRKERRDTYLRIFRRELEKGEKNEGRFYMVPALEALPSDPPDQRLMIEALAAKYIPQPKNIPFVGPADPAAPGPGPGNLKLTPIRLVLAGADLGEVLPRTFEGLFPAGPGTDVLWTYEAIYLMKEKGTVRPLWRVAPPRAGMIAAPVYDGKYLWVTVYRRGTSPLLLVFDPASEKMWDVTKAEGLPRPPEGPAVEPMIWPAPLGPGRACLVGSFSQRGWVGTATFDPTTGTAVVKVFHEAKEAPERSDRTQWKRPEVGFRPALVATLEGKPDPDGKPARRVLVVRGSRENPTLNEYPLVVDPDLRTVEIMQEPLKSTSSIGLYPSLSAFSGGNLYFIRPGPLGRNPRPGDLIEVAGPGPTQRVVTAEAPYSQGSHTSILGHGGKVHFVMEHYREYRPGKPPEAKPAGPTLSPGTTPDAAYWVLDPERKSVELVASRVPGLRTMFGSSHYGLVATVVTDLHSPRFVWTLNQVEVARPGSK